MVIGLLVQIPALVAPSGNLRPQVAKNIPKNDKKVFNQEKCAFMTVFCQTPQLKNSVDLRTRSLDKQYCTIKLEGLARLGWFKKG